MLVQDELKRIIRFFCVSLCGTSIDALIGLALLNFFAFPLPVCVTIGFFCGLCVGYILHRYWTFKKQPDIDNGSSLRFFANNIGLIILRLIFIKLLGYALEVAGMQGGKLVDSFLYIIMLGFSFSVNYISCRLWVFRPVRKNTTDGQGFYIDKDRTKG